MALIKCTECGKDISDKAVACPHCGCPIAKDSERNDSETKVGTANNKTAEPKEMPKKKSKKMLFIVIPFILIALFFGIVMKFGQTDIENELEMVEKLFSLNYKEILSEYPNAELEYPDDEDIYDLYIVENFAGLSGSYNVCVSDDGTVWRVIFEPEDEDTNGKYIAEALEAFFGKHDEYDEEWNAYTWKSENLKIECYVEERTYFEWIGEDLEVNNEYSTEEDADSEIGVIENIHTATDIPDALMNDEFKNAVDLLSKGFSQSGLDISDATTYDDGETYIFYLDNLEFLGDECDDDYFQPRIIYSGDAINNDGTPDKLFFEFANPLKSNGYEETVEMVEDITEALDISDAGLIDNDYSSSSKLANGEYATFTFPNLGLELTVSNTDGTVEIEIVPVA